MKFPKVIRYRRSQVVIYGKRPSYPFYRIAYYNHGKRVMESFPVYTEALQEAEKKVRKLAEGSPELGLSPKQASEALAVFAALDSFRKETGRSLTPVEAIGTYLEAARKLGSTAILEAVDAYLRNSASLKPKALSEAVEEFIGLRAPKGVAAEGKRSALNPKYVANVAAWLREFSRAFPGHLIGDLTRKHLDRFFASHAKLSAKSRNDRRGTLRLFFGWCIRNDFLSAAHRLLEADGMVIEARETGVIDFFRAEELQKLLKQAGADMQPVIAIQALAGLRLEETLRLDWSDVFRITGHIEVSSAKSKTRSRRLVEVCPSLARWLETYRGHTGKVSSRWGTLNGYVQAFASLRDGLKIPSRRNGLRHAFVTFHLALHQNENVTAAEAGTSPAMIHGHYRGLGTKEEAAKWFKVAPAPTENIIPLKQSANLP